MALVRRLSAWASEGQHGSLPIICDAIGEIPKLMPLIDEEKVRILSSTTQQHVTDQNGTVC